MDDSKAFKVPGISTASLSRPSTESAVYESRSDVVQLRLPSSSSRPNASGTGGGLRSSVLPRSDLSSTSNSTTTKGDRFSTVNYDGKSNTDTSICHTTTAGGFPLEDCSWIGALIESRGTGKEVGIALYDTLSGQCIMTQFADTQTYAISMNTLRRRLPHTVIIPSNHDVDRMQSLSESVILVNIIEKNIKRKPQAFNRKHWNAVEGAQKIERLLVGLPDDWTARPHRCGSTPVDGMPTWTESSEETIRVSEEVCRTNSRDTTLRALSKKYFALSAASALFRWLEDELNITFPSRSVNIKFEPPEGTIMIDGHTVADLELIQSAWSNKTGDSLLGTYGACNTVMAERMLRMNILQPFAEEESITLRLDAVEELLNTEGLLFALQEALKPLSKKKIDFDKLILQLITTIGSGKTHDPKMIEGRISHMINLCTILDMLRPVSQAVKGAHSALLQGSALYLENESLASITNYIRENMNADLLNSVAKSNVSSKHSKLLAIKSGQSPVLDVARETYKENVGDVADLCKRLCDKHKVPLTLKQGTHGYHFELKIGDQQHQLANLPAEFIVKSRSRKTCALSTLELVKINRMIADSEEEIFLLSQRQVEQLRTDILFHIGALYKASESLALVDVLSSLAGSVKGSGSYVRPQFTGRLAVKGGRHPILDRKIKSRIRPNDTYLPPGKTFQLITGPNMSGKTTYLKQVALLLIMASIGSFVPAEYASFHLVDRILTRLSNDDEPEANLSTFASEMKSAAFILSLATTRSLVVIDEIGRGTSSHEGVAVAHAISEALLKRGAPTIFATHFTQLASTLSTYVPFSAHHLAVKIKQKECSEREAKVKDGSNAGDYQISFLHHLETGVSAEKHYGLALVKTLPFPKEFWENASWMAARLESDASAEESKESQSERVFKRREAIVKLHQTLEKVLFQALDLSSGDYGNLLYRLQQEFVKDIQATYTNL